MRSACVWMESFGSPPERRARLKRQPLDQACHTALRNTLRLSRQHRTFHLRRICLLCCYLASVLLALYSTICKGLDGPGFAPRMARVYADVNQHMPRAYWDYDSVNISWGVLENYEVVRKIGALTHPTPPHPVPWPALAKLPRAILNHSR